MTIPQYPHLGISSLYLAQTTTQHLMQPNRDPLSSQTQLNNIDAHEHDLLPWLIPAILDDSQEGMLNMDAIQHDANGTYQINAVTDPVTGKLQEY